MHLWCVDELRVPRRGSLGLCVLRSTIHHAPRGVDLRASSTGSSMQHKPDISVHLLILMLQHVNLTPRDVELSACRFTCAAAAMA